MFVLFFIGGMEPEWLTDVLRGATPPFFLDEVRKLSPFPFSLESKTFFYPLSVTLGQGLKKVLVGL